MRRLHAGIALSTLAAGLVTAGAAPAQEADQVAIPAGCTAYLTVQSKDCSVTHYFTCERDPAGLKRRADFDERGLTYLGATDAEGQWIESDHVLSRHREELAPAPADAQSLTELFATGEDTWDFTTNSAEIGPTRYSGYDRLTGETVEIDGVTLDRTEYSIVARGADGTEYWRSAGNEYVSRDLRMFFGGTGRVTTPDETFDQPDGSPVEFIGPGEPGFLSPNPKFGCGVVMSRWTPLD